MDWYDKPENVNTYIGMAEGYDGQELIDILKKYLNPGDSVLEIGMGPGTDLDILKKTYEAVGSDNSEIFINRYRKMHPEADLLKLDAVSLETDRKFNAVYSNKVLHHLEYRQMAASLERQCAVLSPGGVAMHSFWYGNEIENYDGMMFYQLTEAALESLLPSCLKIVEMKRYSEMEEMDSFYAVFTADDF